MNEMMITIIINLEKVGIGILMLLGAYVANMALGAWRNVKIEGWDFDWRLIADSAVKFVVLVLGIGLLSIVISVVPTYATYIGIDIAPEAIEFLDNAVIVGAFLTATIRYAKDAIEKLVDILK